MSRYLLPLRRCETCGGQARPVVVDGWVHGYVCADCGDATTCDQPRRVHPMLTDLAAGEAGCGDT